MASLKTECRKFSANIFNKTKCQNCFRGKDVHSAEALESNRATRKISFCGYLFVAPDWDFTLPANRNKRWQRRWFVLYDDGELVYSVDECPETVPQAVIDMNTVLEVTDAETITGNLYSLAITLSEKVHFIKGTNKEETKKWYEVLSRFPHNTVCGKYKRSATFPAIKPISSSNSENNFTDLMNKHQDTHGGDYSKTGSYVRCMERNFRSSHHQGYDLEDVIPTKDTCFTSTTRSFDYKSQEQNGKCKTSSKDNLEFLKTLREHNQQLSHSGKWVGNVSPTSNSCTRENAEGIFSKHLKQKQDGKESRKQHSRSDVAPMIPSLIPWKSSDKNCARVSMDAESIEYHNKNYHYNPVYLLMSDVPPGKKFETYEKHTSDGDPANLPRQTSFGSYRNFRYNKSWLDEHHEIESGRHVIHKSASVPNATSIVSDKNESSHYSNPLYNDANSKRILDSFLLENSRKGHLVDSILVRGDPDGCNLDSLPSCGGINMDCNSEASSLKKGWLVKQQHNKWNKHWFVLRNLALTYYADPIAEDAGILDGVVDLRKVQSVSEIQSSSGHTFCILMKDDSKIFLSAVTAKMRNNWIRAIIQARKLKHASTEDSSKQKHDLLCASPVPKNLSVSIQRNPSISSADSDGMIQRKHNEFKNGSTEEDDLEISSRRTSIALPPSPPVTRTALSKVKERARSRSRSRTPRFNSTEVHETENTFMDSDDGTTDHSSSSLSMTPVSLSKVEHVAAADTTNKTPEEKSKSERRRSLKLSSSDSLLLPDKRRKVLEIKDKLEDSSWTIWLDVSKFCKEVEAKLDDIEKNSGKETPRVKNLEICQGTPEKKKEISHLVACLAKVEKRLHKVHDELAKAKVDLLLTNKEDMELASKMRTPSISSIQASGWSEITAENVLLSQQLSKMKEENRQLKQDLKAAQCSSDKFELNCISLNQDLKQKQDLHQSQTDLMVARVDDLTAKLLNSEKNVRQLRQRVMKLEQRQERRRSSLKGKEALSLSKEYETKLCELEQKIGAVESALKTNEDTTNTLQEKDSSSKETQNLLLRLHSLDRKVKDVSHIIDRTGEEDMKSAEDFEKPKICLQVKLNEEIVNHDTNEENWNSLSLSTSMTDLSSHENNNTKLADKPLGLSVHDCLENFNYKVTSLVSWLKVTLQLMSEECCSDPTNKSESMNIFQSDKELKKLSEILEHACNAIGNATLTSQDARAISQNLLYKIVLLQEIASILFRISNFMHFKDAVLIQHLTQVKQVITDLEAFIAQKTNSVSIHSPKISLCNIVANLFFHRLTFPAGDIPDIHSLFKEVEENKNRLSTTIFVFREKFIENFCTTISELSENSLSDKPSSPDTKQLDHRLVGQKQFLSHINHIISQVSNSFLAHISKSLNEVYFLCFDMRYNEKWSVYISKLLQQELVSLTAEIKDVCLKHLGSDFYSGSKCGVLVEYMHCSIWELAQIVSINSVVEGTTFLIKDTMSGKCSEIEIPEESALENLSSVPSQTNLDSFHKYLLQQAKGIMSNLPIYNSFNASWDFCNSNEVNVAHRSVSSLLCFKQKCKSTIEIDRKAYKLQIAQLTQKLSALLDEQQNRQKSGCKSCIELRQEVCYLQAELDESRALARSGSLCEKCTNLKLEIQKLMEQQERNTFLIQRLDEQEENWKNKVQEVVKEKEKLLAEEKQKFENELKEAQQHLKMMKNQYDEDLQNLKSLCEQKLTQSQTDALKCRYNTEVDHLKTLCEKGLEVMEVTHRKIIAELEQRHQKEVEDLLTEREKVLAEEAQATCLALEAVRKAHKEEMQNQIKTFKDEFMHRMTEKFETEAFKRGFESEMSKIKHEILAITEKYSIKCLENIGLQENLETVTEQLRTSNSQVFELQAINKQLQARLVSASMQKLEELI